MSARWICPEPAVNGGGFAGNGLEVVIPEGGFRGLGPMNRLEPAPREAWYRYHVRLLIGTRRSRASSPGSPGSTRHRVVAASHQPKAGPDGQHGACSAHLAPRVLRQVRSRSALTSITSTRRATCGDDLWWPGAALRPGRWHCVEGHVRLNDPSAHNGRLHGWLDGRLRFEMGGIAFRRPGENNIGIRHMWHNVYFGGDWPTPNRLDLIIDQVAVSTHGRVGCMDPFTDDNSSLFRPALTELHARGLLFGCGYRLACPDRTITRGEAAAFFHRVMGLPATTKDFFRDDGNSTFQNAINRLAAEGIVRGCAPRAFCPDRLLTRAEFAAMAVRALGLPRDVPNAFADDNRHWAESAIDAFDAAGITQWLRARQFLPEPSADERRGIRLLRPCRRSHATPWPGISANASVLPATR